jgi:phage terminase large subunit-like protein
MTALWYTIKTFANFETRVADSIREKARQRGLPIEEVLVPKEKVVGVRRGRKYPEQCIGWIKKTGKTGTAAMHGLTTLLVYGGRYAEGYCIAADLQQAQERVFGEIKRICECSPLLRRECEITASRILFPQMGASVTALAGDYASAAGAHPTWVSADEVWTIINERGLRLFEEMAPVPTQQISCRLITTHAGFSGESTLLEELHAKGMSLPEIAPNLHAGGGMLFTWRHVPLAPWQTQEWLDEKRATTRPLRYLQQYENRIVSPEGSFITGAMFDRTIKPVPDSGNAPLEIFVGVDAAYLHDNAAVAAVTVEKNGNIRLVYFKIFKPSPSNPLNFETTIVETLLDLKKRYRVRLVYVDPTQMVSIMQRLQKTGLKIEELVQNPANQIAMGQNLYDLFHTARFETFADSKLRDAVTRTVFTEKNGLRITKNPGIKNDLVIALAMACLAAAQRGQLSVDLVHKYRAFDPDFVDEDLPKPVKQEIKNPDEVGYNNWHQCVPRSAPTYSSNDLLRQLYGAIDIASKTGRGF